jgi:hypothetical protein
VPPAPHALPPAQVCDGAVSVRDLTPQPAELAAAALHPGVGAGPDVLSEAKALAASKTGMKPENMLISSTHTHSGPSLNTRS